MTQTEASEGKETASPSHEEPVLKDRKHPEDIKHFDGTEDPKGTKDFKGTEDLEGRKDLKGTEDLEGRRDFKGTEDIEGKHDLEGTEDPAGVERVNLSDAEGANRSQFCGFLDVSVVGVVL